MQARSSILVKQVGEQLCKSKHGLQVCLQDCQRQYLLRTQTPTQGSHSVMMNTDYMCGATAIRWMCCSTEEV